MTKDIAVVGGGVAGLTAAIEAAGAGASVTVYDARTTLGGRARTRNKAGFQLNEGAHALYQGGPAMAFLKELGREPAGGVPDVSGGVGIDGPLVGQFPAGLVSLLRTPLLRGDRLGMVKLFVKLGRLDPSDYADMTVSEAMTTLLGHGTGARFGHALIRLSSYGHDPDRASADIGLGQLKMALGSGVRYLDHGWQTIINSLRTEAEARGVNFVTESKVSMVRPLALGHSSATGPNTVELTVGDRTRRHDAAILAAGGPQHAAAILGDAAPELTARAATARPATVACLDVGLAGPWGSHPTFALGIDQPLYLSVHAPVAKLAPQGQTLVHVMRYHHPDHSPDPADDRRSCEAMLDQIRPGWRAEATHIGFRPRLVAAHDQASAATGGLTGRQPVTVSDAPGVFLAGDWVGDQGALVDASVASGRQAGATAAETDTATRVMVATNAANRDMAATNAAKPATRDRPAVRP